MENFRKFLCDTIAVPVQDTEYWIGQCTVQSVEKNDYILQPGMSSYYVYYSESGILRMFYIDSNGKEHIVQFGSEIWLAYDRESFYFDKPAKYYIQAIENAEVVCIKKDVIYNIVQAYPQCSEKYIILLNKWVSRLQERVSLFIGSSAKDRYLDFMETYPNYLQRIPLYMIASYLGITPECLSRVRNDLVIGKKTGSAKLASPASSQQI